MFIHNFKYTLKTLLKNKMLIFWTLAFPIILGTLFNMAFSNIENSEKLDIIDIAIVNNDYFNNSSFYKETFKFLSDASNDNKLFNIKYIDHNEALHLLEEKEISGYLLLEEKPKVVVNTSGINETIFKQVVSSIERYEKIFQNVINKEVNKSSNNGSSDYDLNTIYNDAYSLIYSSINDYKSNIVDISSSKLSYTMIEFYTLIAMSCLYGGILGMSSINQNLANMSHIGKRNACSPVSKFRLILSSALASFLVQLVGVFLLFIYTVFVLKVDYGNNFPLILLLTIVGSLAGLSLGIMTSCTFKTNENVKVGIMISIAMLGSFLSGMMGITMKYIIDKNVPLLNKINPVNMITDGFYSLYYYDTNTRFYFNIISLLIFSLIMFVISLFSLRRQKYDSI